MTILRTNFVRFNAAWNVVGKRCVIEPECRPTTVNASCDDCQWPISSTLYLTLSEAILENPNYPIPAGSYAIQLRQPSSYGLFEQAVYGEFPIDPATQLWSLGGTSLAGILVPWPGGSIPGPTFAIQLPVGPFNPNDENYMAVYARPYCAPGGLFFQILIYQIIYSELSGGWAIGVTVNTSTAAQGGFPGPCLASPFPYPPMNLGNFSTGGPDVLAYLTE